MNTARLLSVAAVCVLAGSSAWARDLKTVNGEVFKNITVTKQDATGLEITHDDGVIFVDFRNLGPAEQKEFGYNPTAYAAAWKKKIADDKARREQTAAARAAAKSRAQAAAAAATPAPVTGYSYNPPTVSNQTTIESYYDAPGLRWGPYDYGRPFAPTVPQSYGGNGVIPIIPYNPYGPYPNYNGAVWGPTIIRRR
jgi:hypothetical protein